MNQFKYTTVFILSCLLFGACEYLNLERDNPLDGKNNTNTIDGVALKYDNYTVYSDNNGDKIVNKGETVQLKVVLKNNGTSTAKGVKVTFSTNSTHVAGLAPIGQIIYGDIAAGSSKYVDYRGDDLTNSYTIQFTVSAATPDNTQIPISISMVDKSNNIWTDNFTVTVVGTSAQIAFDNYSVYSDNNGDKIVNKGETVQMKVSLKNNGTSTAKGVKATFSTSSTHVAGLTPIGQITYGDIAAGSSKYVDYRSDNLTNSYTIQFTVLAATPDNTQIPISISMMDESNNMWTDNFTVTVVGTNAQVAFDNYSIYSDNNGDKSVNKGETVQLKVSLKNNGTSTAKGVKATFSTSSTHVAGLAPTGQIIYGDIAAGSSKYVDYGGYSLTNSYTIQFTVLAATPDNTQIPISISMVDESNNIWTDNFTVTVVRTSAQISFDNYSVYSDNNRDKIINKGETVQLKVFLKNNGTSTAKGVKTTFSTSSTHVAGLAPTGQIIYGDIAAGSSKYVDYGGYSLTNSYTIQFTVLAATPDNTQIPISISMVDESNNVWTDSFNVTVK